jgi:NitT/TauT family transport system substrate-binding protein
MRLLRVLLIFTMMALPSLLFGAQFRIGLMPAKESLPFYAEERLGVFKKNGIDLVVIPFRSALERDAAFEAGKIDGAVNDIVGTMLLQKSGRNVKIFRTLAKPAKGSPVFRIMGGQSAGLARDIAISSNTVIEYVTDRILESKGTSGSMKKTEIKSVPLRMQLLLEGKVGYATIAEPLASYVEMKGAGTYGGDEGVKGSHVVFVARGDTDSQLMKAMVTALDETNRQVNMRKDELKDLLWAKLSLPDELKVRYLLPDLSVRDVPSRDAVADVAAWMLKKGLLKEPVAYEAVVAK